MSNQPLFPAVSRFRAKSGKSRRTSRLIRPPFESLKFFTRLDRAHREATSNSETEQSEKLKERHRPTTRSKLMYFNSDRDARADRRLDDLESSACSGFSNTKVGYAEFVPDGKLIAFGIRRNPEIVSNPLFGNDNPVDAGNSKYVRSITQIKGLPVNDRLQRLRKFSDSFNNAVY